MSIIKNVRQLNELITFKKVVPKSGPEVGYDSKELFSCWTHVRTQRIRDVKQWQGTLFENTIDFIIRYQQPQPIDNSMTVVWQGNEYNIVEINPDTGSKEFTVIVCKKK